MSSYDLGFLLGKTLTGINSNDAVIPISESYPGCPDDPDGLCPFTTVVPILVERINEINYNYDCFGNYTAKAGVDYNGRAPH